MYYVSPLQVRHIYFLFDILHMYDCNFQLIKTQNFVKDFSPSIHTIDLIFGQKLLYDDLYRFSPFQGHRTFTSCLPKLWLKFWTHVTTKHLVRASVSHRHIFMVFFNFKYMLPKLHSCVPIFCYTEPNGLKEPTCQHTNPGQVLGLIV